MEQFTNSYVSKHTKLHVTFTSSLASDQTTNVSTVSALGLCVRLFNAL